MNTQQTFATHRERDAAIFAACLGERSYYAIARDYDLSAARIEQIFEAEAASRHPEIFRQIGKGIGFRYLFTSALSRAAA